jgi:hypothetical protein
MGLQSSPVRAREEEFVEAKPMRGSPEHERRRRGGMLAMKISGGLRGSPEHERRRRVVLA